MNLTRSARNMHQVGVTRVIGELTCFTECTKFYAFALTMVL